MLSYPHRTCRPLRRTRIGPRLLHIFVLGGAFLASCSVQTTIPELPRDVPASWRSDLAAARADEDTRRTSMQPDLANWWRAFDDAALNQLIERALHDNLTIQMAGERLTAARSLRHRARSQFWPNLNFGV